MNPTGAQAGVRATSAKVPIEQCFCQCVPQEDKVFILIFRLYLVAFVMDQIRKKHSFRKVLYVGDGNNDVCPATRLMRYVLEDEKTKMELGDSDALVWFG
jgi:hypothetical protein